MEQLDASETSLAAIIDDARAMSLFASERLIFVANAEAAMPRSSRTAASSGEDESEDGGAPGANGDAAILHAYVKSFTPGVTLIFEATRWDFEGDDKTKNDRARKFYGAITEVVEFRRFSPDEARGELDRIARAAHVRLDPAAAEDLPLLVPDARQSTIFALVNALGRRDRARSLDTLDSLVREGEYLPLALTFLATQFRMALVVREANLRGASQVQGHFAKAGIPMWGSRAEQVSLTAAKFSREQLERGLKLIFEADRDLRSARPDDRTVMENFVVRLCEAA
jgi:DNA polymerase-3 subunit delta